MKCRNPAHQKYCRFGVDCLVGAKTVIALKECEARIVIGDESKKYGMSFKKLGARMNGVVIKGKYTDFTIRVHSFM
jgi:hypothetical protein